MCGDRRAKRHFAQSRGLPACPLFFYARVPSIKSSTTEKIHLRLPSSDLERLDLRATLYQQHHVVLVPLPHVVFINFRIEFWHWPVAVFWRHRCPLSVSLLLRFLTVCDLEMLFQGGPFAVQISRPESGPRFGSKFGSSNPFAGHIPSPESGTGFGPNSLPGHAVCGAHFKTRIWIQFLVTILNFLTRK